MGQTGDSSIDRQVEELVEWALNEGRTPEDVCVESPELLPAVRCEWERSCRVRDLVDDWFPSVREVDREPTGGNRTQAEVSSDPITQALPLLPGYEVERLLGLGGMGVVFYARHLHLRRPVAIKMLIAGGYAGALERARFLREARAVASLRHPHVVQIYDVGEHDGRPYFTMELMEGGSLARKLAGAPQPPEDSARLIAVLARAIHAAHQAGIVHRDLKPANILLTADGTAKVCDFGLARQLSEEEPTLTLSGARLGTPSYMAPEQAAGRHSDVGPTTDVYALGATLYEMLTGRPPFKGDSVAETERQVLHVDPVPPAKLNPRVPRDLETVCLKCLSKDSARRYQSADELVEELDRFIRGESVLARRPMPPERVVRWARRHPAAATLWAGGAGIALILIMAVVAWAADRRATVLAVEDDLRELTRLQQESAWGPATITLNRAADRLGYTAPGDIRVRVAAARRDTELGRQLEQIALSKITTSGGMLHFNKARQAYTVAFRDAGLGSPGDDPATVATRIAASKIKPALVDALYDWTRCRPPDAEWRWIIQTALLAAPDPTGWRQRASDPRILMDPVALSALAADESVVRQPLPLVISVADYMRRQGINAVPMCRRVHLARPNDFWINYELGRSYRMNGNPVEAIGFYRVAVAMHPDLPMAHVLLAITLVEASRPEEAVAVYRKALELDPLVPTARFNLAGALMSLGRAEDAIPILEVGTRLKPDDVTLSVQLADVLVASGRYEKAIPEYRRAIAVEPSNGRAHRGLREALAVLGRPEEVKAAWNAMLLAGVTEHEAWSGYAEYCLYIRDTQEYERARRLLLQTFGDSTDPAVCERTGRACLLLPPKSQADLLAATRLIDRALDSEKPKQTWRYPYFQFAKALAEIRSGRPQAAMAIVDGPLSATPPFGAAPHFLASLAHAQLGQRREALRALALAGVGYDWSPGAARDADAWLQHALRLQAEAESFSESLEYVKGTYEPHTDDQCIALLPTCQANELNAAYVKLWESVARSNPARSEPMRKFAARAAVLSGLGRGRDAGDLDAPTRERLRTKARQWIREYVVVVEHLKRQRLPLDGPVEILRWWRRSSDLADVCNPYTLASFSDTERADWIKLWSEVDAAIEPVEARQSR